MEEDSEVNSVKEVSSTTTEVSDLQQAVGVHANVETVILVEKVKEEEIINNDTVIEPSDNESKNMNETTINSKLSPKKEYTEKNIISPHKVDHKSNLKQNTSAIPEKMPTTMTEREQRKPMGSENQQKTPTKLEQVLPVEIQKNSTQIDESQALTKSEEGQMSPKNPKQVQLSILEQEQNVLTKSGQVQQISENCEQVPNPQAMHNEVPKILKQSPIKSLNIQSQNVKNLITVTNSTEANVVTVIKSLEGLEAVLVQQIPTKEASLIKKSPKKHELSIKSPVKLDTAKQSDKLSAKESSIQLDSNKNSPPKSEKIKELLENVKGDKKNDKKEELVFNSSIDICDKSNDCQVEPTLDISEKEHNNKSISRELKSLIKSAKESKIISECTQLTSKTRKSRAAFDNSNTSLNTSVEADKIHSVRRSSITSQKSNCSEKSEKAPTKRSMRSQNPEFVNKVKQFLNSVTGKIQKDTDDEETDNKKDTNFESFSPNPKKKKMVELHQLDPASEQSNKLISDIYCWRCHWAVEQSTTDKGHPPLQCTVCPRSFHYKCLSGNERSKTINEKSWVCPECLIVLHAESSETRSPAMKKISLGLLCELLQYALGRMMDLNGVEPFVHPVDRTAFPDYDKYVVHPMDLSLMKKNISEGLYGSTEAFLADAQWILHNSIIFNTCMMQSKLTGGARALVRSCRAEMGEIEACPECYSAAHARRPTWFTDVCSTPHILLWAKLKGFPYWPAKGMSVNGQGLVDVRFFGAHDRAWVHARDCFLYCEKDPNNFKAKRQDILESMQEAEQHIRTISRKYGKFVYAPFKTQFDPTKLSEQLKMMIPSFDGEIKSQVKEKSMNTSPNGTQDASPSNQKRSIHEGDISENEDTQATPSRKMADGAEIAREEEDFSIEKDKPMEVNEPAVEIKEKEHSRKRRRSGLEEAVITIITTTNSEKRQKLETNNKDNKKTDNLEGTTGKEGDASNIDKSIKKNKKTNNKVDDKEVLSTPISIDMDKPNNEVEKPPVTPFTPKIRPSKASTPKEKAEKSITPKHKVKTVKTLQSAETEKKKHDENIKTQKRRKSRSKSLNSSHLIKEDRSSSKRNEKDNLPSNSKEQIKEPNPLVGELETNNIIDVDNAPDKANITNNKTIDSSKQDKDQINFDDDTSLAVIARETAKQIISGLPTISSVRSLWTVPSNTNTSKPTMNTKKIEITVPMHPEVNVFTPTSTDNVRSMKEAVDKLQKLKNGKDKPAVGRVGVRAFARMTSPPALPPPTETQAESVEVEVKSEPIDFDDADRQVEKIDLMRAFHLRPVNPVTTANLRDVRRNKVVVAPIARKAVTKTTEVRIRTKKSFPQSRKDGNDGRSELNGKNSMVYIPIQPPSTQAPIQRQTRPITINGSANTQTVRPQVSAVIANSVVNTVSTALVPLPMTSCLSSPISRPAATIVTNSTNNAICVPTVGQVPTAVHTVPLITSVNGQWTFSLQPVMSVGGESATSPPVVNGLPERNKTFVPIAPAPHITLPSSQIPPNNKNVENTPGEPPRLQQRPPLLNPLDPNTPSSEVPAPSTAGPLTAKLSQNAVKLADFFRNLLEDSLDKIDDPASQATFFKLQLEQAQWRHQQQVNEIKHAHELLITEMRVSYEKEKTRAISEMRRAAQVELEAAIKAAKTKQWCANCSQEAQFYCCWNTSYCDYSCQRSHWSQHFSVCTQQRNSDNNANENGNSLEKRLQPAPDCLPKNTGAPTLAVGTKIAPTRVYAQEGIQQKQSIIVSMVDDHSGSQMLKCVGTYKPPGQQQVSPLIINKQIMNEDNAAKKVVTSGGYLIVGGGNNSPITPARRTHPVQYTYTT